MLDVTSLLSSEAWANIQVPCYIHTQQSAQGTEGRSGHMLDVTSLLSSEAWANIQFPCYIHTQQSAQDTEGRSHVGCNFSIVI